MKRVIFTLISAIVLISCEEDFDIQVYGKTIPVVYGVYYLKPMAYDEDTISSYKLSDPNFIKLTRSFSSMDNPSESAIVHDSLYFRNPVVKIEYYYQGNLIGSHNLVENNNFNKETGLFTQSYNIVYQTTEHEVSRIIDIVRLIIDTGEECGVISAVAPYVSSPYAFLVGVDHFENSIGFYRKNNPLIISWKDNCGFYETTFKIKYLELLSGELVTKELIWRKTRLSKNSRNYLYFDWNEILDGLGVITDPITIPDDISVYYYGDEFYNFIRSNIKDNPDVTKRKFENVNIIVTATTRTFYDYLNFGKSTQDNGKIFTNINNGIGIFTTACSNKFEGLVLDKQSEDSLVFGHLTKHLKFVTYDIGN